MARAEATDYLQAFRFHLQDLGGGLIGGANVFSGVLGFSSISGLSVQTEYVEIKEGTWPFPRLVVTGASTSSITLARAITAKDVDFYRWFMSNLFGDRVTRRNLLLTIKGRQETQDQRWILYHCVPVKVTPWDALDAKSNEIVRAELEIKPEFIDRA